ncbi:unnamed protein product [marine sediment metagenome]|uniref:Uncharacterized protein n=1 Tax=marine sediment metagenome TaxID=412755 RepID=X1AFW3_9ZZZZ
MDNKRGIRKYLPRIIQSVQDRLKRGSDKEEIIKESAEFVANFADAILSSIVLNYKTFNECILKGETKMKLEIYHEEKETVVEKSVRLALKTNLAANWT